MRITEAMTLNTVLQSEQTAASRMAQLSTQSASGLTASEPSDNPTVYASVVEQTAQIGMMTSRQSTVNVAAGNLNLAESTLDQASTLLQQAQSIAVEAANGTQDASSRANAAQQITSLTSQMVALANTQGSGGYLFGGTKTNAPPFDSNGNFLGNDDSTQIEVANGVLAPSSASGAQAFTAAGGRDVFADLQALSTALTNDDTTGIQSSIGNLQTSYNQVVSAHVDAGEKAGRLQSASTAMGNALTQMQVTLSSTADVDAPTTFSNLQAAQLAYQQAISVNQDVLSTAYAKTS
jgi:flagellar hook-associated protein 3 FlgL